MSRSSFQVWRSVILSGFVLGVAALAHAQPPALHKVTLFSRQGHDKADYAKSAYNFYAMARADNYPKTIGNRSNLFYGSFAVKGDSDWFSVSGGGAELTRIKDLGLKQWREMVATPFIAVPPHATQGIRVPKAGESYEQASEERVTKVALGHMYVIHIKGDKEDYYVMLRVDELVPSDNCTISWRVVPPPNQPWK